MSENRMQSKIHDSIMIVDDTIENLRLLSGMLADRGFDVRPVTSARDALQAIEQDPPALILLDISMPEMDGFELCTHLKASDAYRDIPVIFLTAFAETNHKVRGFSVGGADYITKPFQIDEVFARVNHHLSYRRAQIALADNLERQKQLERLRDDLVHMIVHDMRSPLAVMIGNLALARSECEGELKAVLDDVYRAAHGLNRMANTVLDVSRLEDGKMPLAMSACDLSSLATSVCDSLGTLDAKRKIDVSVPGPVQVACDADLIRRILENLVTNAIKHTPRGGKLSIEVAQREQRVRVAVRDEGQGIDPEVRGRLFEKFATAGAHKDTGYHSVGLGLAFCKLAVEAHGGTIAVEDAVPRGSVFYFELPA
jgi:two-component system sensor histidine kinase/response regulator